jgi:hypothetical protein
MAWHDFIGIRNLDTSLTDEEAASLPAPEPDPDDLAICPPQFYEVFTGISGGGSGTLMAETQWTAGGADYTV